MSIASPWGVLLDILLFSGYSTLIVAHGIGLQPMVSVCNPFRVDGDQLIEALAIFSHIYSYV